jgi:ABC-type Fe3+-hydroxamate transport system substrate-binding protein
MGRLETISGIVGLGLSLGLLGSAGAAVAQEVCAAGTHLFEDAILVEPVCVPDEIKRPAFIDENVVHALELGIPSVTRQYYAGTITTDLPGLLPKLEESSPVDIGNPWEMKGELLLTAEPDLVISSDWLTDANVYAKGMAPTLIVDTTKTKSWRDVPRMLARLFGKEAEQAALEQAVDARAAAFKAALAASGKPNSFSFTQVENETSFWTFTTAAFGLEFGVDAGMVTGPQIPTPEVAATLPGGSNVALPVSQENLAFLEADHMFFYANIGSDAEQLVSGNAIFQHFAEAHPGGVHFLKGEYWFRPSAASAQRIIDDLYEAVLGVDPETVSPNPLAWTYK